MSTNWIEFEPQWIWKLWGNISITSEWIGVSLSIWNLKAFSTEWKGDSFGKYEANFRLNFKLKVSHFKWQFLPPPSSKWQRIINISWTFGEIWHQHHFLIFNWPLIFFRCSVWEDWNHFRGKNMKITFLEQQLIRLTSSPIFNPIEASAEQCWQTRFPKLLIFTNKKIS